MDPKAQQTLLQYLREAHASELGLIGVLTEQIAMTPHSRYRTALDTHLKETGGHATRLQRRIGELGGADGPVQVVIGLAQGAIAQTAAIAKAPLDLLRGSGGEEKVLKNAKDACATEALEIATYAAIEELARRLDDQRTADLAASIRAEEERMLERIMKEIPALTAAMAGFKVDGNGSYELGETGAADVLREAGRRSKRSVNATARGAARQARKVPGVQQAEGAAKGAVAKESDLPINGYDDLTVAEVNERIRDLSQIDLAKLATYEARHQDRSTVLERINSLVGEEPWSGYDSQTVKEITTALHAGDRKLASKVRRYEKAHKARAGVLKATERAEVAA